MKRSASSACSGFTPVPRNHTRLRRRLQPPKAAQLPLGSHQSPRPALQQQPRLQMQLPQVPHSLLWGQTGPQNGIAGVKQQSVNIQASYLDHTFAHIVKTTPLAAKWLVLALTLGSRLSPRITPSLRGGCNHQDSARLPLGSHASPRPALQRATKLAAATATSPTQFTLGTNRSPE